MIVNIIAGVVNITAIIVLLIAKDLYDGKLLKGVWLLLLTLNILAGIINMYVGIVD